MFEIVFFIAASILLALLLLWGFFHFLITITGIDDTDRKPVVPLFLVGAVVGLVLGPVVNFAWVYFHRDPQATTVQPSFNMVSPVIGLAIFGLIGGLAGLTKALRVEKASTPRDEISQIQFSEISQWMKKS
jgi:NADH:ubiquinone oxidoreductase subunit 5 (subunit L)/multisubunit Na+/H+ antiporter MnhA subunit